VVPVVPGERRSEKHEIKRIGLQGLFHGSATDDGGHPMPGFLNRIGLRRQDLRIGFAVQNLELE